jgi:hypothetical protein
VLPRRVRPLTRTRCRVASDRLGVRVPHGAARPEARMPRLHAPRLALKSTPGRVSTAPRTPDRPPRARVAPCRRPMLLPVAAPSLLAVSNTVEDAYKRPWPPLAHASRVAAVSRSAALAIAIAKPSCLSAPSSTVWSFQHLD